MDTPVRLYRCEWGLAIERKLSECVVGDVVISHGGVFVLRELRHSGYPKGHEALRWCDAASAALGSRSFRSEFLGTLERDGWCSVPASWRASWTIQSNDRASWLAIRRADFVAAGWAELAAWRLEMAR
jgi:hypothetical protein